MDKKSIMFIILYILPISAIIHGSVSNETNLFAKIDGFSSEGSVEAYTPDTLFEYIDGGADLFLGFDFVKLYSQRYKDQNGGEITVDIYIHDNLPNGFGIYTAEKPDECNLVKIGTEGYYEEGILNFFQGPVYVKLSSFDLGKNEKEKLMELAGEISSNIPHKKVYPYIFSKFPTQNKIKGSEKYTNLNFMGHSFLNKAYSAKYSVKEKIKRLFVIKTGSSLESEKILSEYIGFIKNKNGTITKIGNVIRFTDPYYKKEGKMNIMISGDILTGMLSNDIGSFLNMAKMLLSGK